MKCNTCPYENGVNPEVCKVCNQDNGKAEKLGYCNFKNCEVYDVDCRNCDTFCCGSALLARDSKESLAA